MANVIGSDSGLLGALSNLRQINERITTAQQGLSAGLRIKVLVLWYRLAAAFKLRLRIFP